MSSSRLQFKNLFEILLLDRISWVLQAFITWEPGGLLILILLINPCGNLHIAEAGWGWENVEQIYLRLPSEFVSGMKFWQLYFDPLDTIVFCW